MLAGSQESRIEWLFREMSPSSLHDHEGPGEVYWGRYKSLNGPACEAVCCQRPLVGSTVPAWSRGTGRSLPRKNILKMKLKKKSPKIEKSNKFEFFQIWKFQWKFENFDDHFRFSKKYFWKFLIMGSEAIGVDFSSTGSGRKLLESTYLPQGVPGSYCCSLSS